MDKLSRENILYMMLSAVLVVGGYWFLRYAYHVADQAPFSQEIVLIILGTIITVLITAILLNKQTEVELKKEENIKFIELKTDIYIQLIDHLEQVIINRDIDNKDKIRLRMLAHKLAIVASPEVLTQFEEFVDRFTKITFDHEVNERDANIIMDQLAALSIYIREDLIGDIDLREGVDQKKLARQIRENSDSLQDL